MRLFVAITPPASALAELEAAVAALRPARPELRWTRSGGWHLTLAFLGEVDQARVADLSRRLDRAAGRRQPLPLSIGPASAFPAAGRARVLWAGIQGDRRGLGQLAQSVAAAARRAGAPPPDATRRYRPHLTLARCSPPTDVSPLVAALAGFAGGTWQADRIDLMLSKTGPRPAVQYQVLDSWPLAHPDPAGR